MNPVYVVGSQEGKFIADRIYSQTNLEGAVDYCDSRNIANLASGKSQWWVVMSAPLNLDWMSWKVVFDKNGYRPSFLQEQP